MIKKIGKTYSARVFWRDCAGARHSKAKTGFSTRAEAAAWEASVLTSNRAATHIAAHRVTVDQLAGEWIAHLRALGRSPATIVNYEWGLSRILPHIGALRVQDVRRGHLQAILDAEIMSGSLSNNSVLTLHRCIRSLFSFAVRDGVLSASPYVKPELPAAKKRPIPRLEPDHVARLIWILRECRHVLYVPVVLCVAYGLRRGEACGLRWCDIDFDRGVIYVTATITRPKGGPMYGATKTRQSADVIALAPWFLDDLRAMRKDRFSSGTLSLASPDVSRHVPISAVDPRVLVTLDRGDYLRPDGLLGRLHRIQAANGLPITSVHDLRKTYASLLLEGGVDIAVISKALRHSSVKITTDQYVADSEPIKRVATRAFDSLIFPDAK